MAKVEANAHGLKPSYSFENLVIGSNNQVASAACKAVSAAPGETYNPLFIYGSSGVGKTHLMQAVAHEMLRMNPSLRVKYISAERFISEVVNAASEDRIMDLRSSYSELELLIIDDVQYMTESKISQEELFHIFNNMHHENHQVILAADRPPNQLTGLNKNVRSRLEWGLASDVQVPDAVTRLQILKKKQAMQGLTLDEAMLTFVSEQLRSNVRELEGFLKRIHAYATLSRQVISMDLVRSVVNEILPFDGETHHPETPGNGHTHTNGGTRKGGESHPANGRPKSSLPPMDEFSSAAAPEPPAPAPPPRPAESAAPKKLSNPFDDIDFAPQAPSFAPRPAAVPPPAFPPPPAVPPSPTVPPLEPWPPPKFEFQSTPKAEAPPKPPVVPAEVPIALDAPGVDGAEEAGDADLPSGHKEIGAVFFFPTGGEEALETVYQKFQDVIKKHKLKFRLKRVHNQNYEFKGKINYSSFVDVCKANRVPVAVVIGPPADTFIPEQDFYDLLTVTLDVQGVSLQLVNWAEINKDYRYLNLALDIALVRSR